MMLGVSLAEFFLGVLQGFSLSVKTVMVDVFDDWLRNDVPKGQVSFPHQTNFSARHIVLEES